MGPRGGGSEPGQMVSDWLNTYSKNKKFHGLMDNVCAGMFACYHYLTKGSMFKKLGRGLEANGHGTARRQWSNY